MPIEKRDIVVTLVLLSAVLLTIEQAHRQPDIETSSPYVVQTAAICPENENNPASAECFAFMGSAFASAVRQRDVDAPPVDFKLPDQVGSPCPDSDSAPYSAECIRFMSGWFWQPVSARKGP
jgi:hypothetical protein